MSPTVEGELPIWKEACVNTRKEADYYAKRLIEMTKEFKRVVDCGWNDGSDLKRFTFRVTKETFERWKEMTNAGEHS